MNRLKVKTFLKITGYIDFKDKLQFACVCKRWCHLIRDHKLYTSLVFRESYKFRLAFNFFNRHESLAGQLESLDLQAIKMDRVHLSNLPTVFPNLKRLQWIDTEKERSKVADIIKRNFKSNMWQHLERLTADSLRMISLDILATRHALNHLISLTITFEHMETADRLASLKQLTKQLHNLPALKYMQLHYACMNLVDLTDLHANTPHLEKLVLNYVRMYNKKDQVVKIMSDVRYSRGKDGQSSYSRIVRNLRYFKATIRNAEEGFYCTKCSREESSMINDSDEEESSNNIIPWLRFWGLKYRGLETFIVTTSNTDMTEMEHMLTLEQEVAATICNMHQLVDYQVTICPFTDKILRILEKNTRVSFEEFHVYLDHDSTWTQKMAFRGSTRAETQTTKLELVNISRQTRNHDVQEDMVGMINLFSSMKRLYIKGSDLRLSSTHFLVELLRKPARSRLRDLIVNEGVVQDVYLQIEAVYIDHSESAVFICVESYRLGNQAEVDRVLKELFAACVSYRRIIFRAEIMCGIGNLSICFPYSKNLDLIDIDLRGEYSARTRLEIHYDKREDRMLLYDLYKGNIALTFGTSAQLQMFYLNVGHMSQPNNGYQLDTVEIDTKPDSALSSQTPTT